MLTLFIPANARAHSLHYNSIGDEGAHALAEALKGAGYTEAQFTAVTKRISTDDALRGKFEVALARPVAR